MISKKINTALSISIILSLATFVAFFSLQLSSQIQTLPHDIPRSIPTPKPNDSSEPIDTSHWKTYQNNEFSFSFRYPDDKDGATLYETANIKRAYLNNDLHLLDVSEKTNSPVKMKAEKLSFSIDLLTANDSDGKKITEVESFLKDYPYRRIRRIREERGRIGSIPTIEDIWSTKDSGMALSETESRTVYAYYNDLIYQITIIPNSGIPARMMESFFFTEPESIIPVGSPTTAKQTDYINTALGFKITFPQGWYFPSPDDSNPRIDNCLVTRGRIYGFSCGVVRIADVTTEFPPGPKFIESILKNYNKVESIDNLVPETTILKVGSHKIDAGPPEPDGIEYFIYFHSNSKVFKVFISDVKFEKNILSSIRLTN